MTGRVSGLTAVFLIASTVVAWGQSLPVEPARESGSSITGAFEGWFKNPDGTFSLLLGYYNRNQNAGSGYSDRARTTASNPAGRIAGQPTHFLPGRGWGLFTVKVPADFGREQNHLDAWWPMAKPR